MLNPVLEISDLHAYYGKSHVLHGVNLHVKPARSSACWAATASAAPPPPRP
jgi:ABC-type histidine transport system ATPase subunit